MLIALSWSLPFCLNDARYALHNGPLDSNVRGEGMHTQLRERIEAGYPIPTDRLVLFGEAAPQPLDAVLILQPAAPLQSLPTVHLEARDISGRVLLPGDQLIQASFEQPSEPAHLKEMRGQKTRRSCRRYGES